LAWYARNKFLKPSVDETCLFFIFARGWAIFLSVLPRPRLRCFAAVWRIFIGFSFCRSRSNPYSCHVSRLRGGADWPNLYFDS